MAIHPPGTTGIGHARGPTKRLTSPYSRRLRPSVGLKAGDADKRCPAFMQQRDSIPAQAVPPILGSSAAFVVWRMFRTWREKCYTDFVLALVPNVGDEMMKAIVGVLVKKT